MKLLVTGADGFLGRHVVAAAVRRGLEVRVFEGEDPRLPGVTPERVPGAVEDPFVWKRAAEGAHAMLATEPVPRAAARGVYSMVQSSLDRARFVLDAAEHGQIERVVRVGSALAVGSSVERLRQLGPEDWTLAKSDPGVRAHVESEQWIAEEARRRGLVLARVLPTHMLGPGSPEPKRDLALLRAYARYRLGLFAHGGMNVVDVRDVAAVLVSAACDGLREGRHLAAGHDLSYKAFYVALAGVLGSSHKHLALPRWVGLLLGALAELSTRTIGHPRSFDRDLVDLTFGRYAYAAPSPDLVALGFEARPVDESMRDSLRHLREIALL